MNASNSELINLLDEMETLHNCHQAVVAMLDPSTVIDQPIRDNICMLLDKLNKDSDQLLARFNQLIKQQASA